MDIFSEFIERMHYDPFDECAQFLAIFATLRLLHDCFTNLLLFSSSSCFLLTSLFLLQNYRFVWPFQGRQSTHKKASACLSSMLVHSLIHFVIALKSRSIFLDAHILLITFLAWRNQMELHERMQWPTREQRRNAQRG